MTKIAFILGIILLTSSNSFASVIQVVTEECENYVNKKNPIKRFSSPLVHAAVPPPYVKDFNIENVDAYLKANGFRSDISEADPKYHRAMQTYFSSAPNTSKENPLAEHHIRFDAPLHYETIRKLGSGDKGTVLLVEHPKKGKVAVKVPIGRTYKPGSADLAINLELEFWLNMMLRDHFSTYGVNVIPVEEFGEDGAFMVMELFNHTQVLGEIVDSIARTRLPDSLRETYYAFATEGNREQLGPIVRTLVSQYLERRTLEKLKHAFLGIQKVSIDRGLNIDFVTDNVAIIDGEVVLFDTGIRTSGGPRSQRYTVGEDFDGSTESLLTFDAWLERSHFNWMMKAGQLPRP